MVNQVLDYIRPILEKYFSTMNPECYAYLSGREPSPAFEPVVEACQQLWSDWVVAGLISEVKRPTVQPGVRNILKTALELRLQNETREILAAIQETELECSLLCNGKVYSWPEFDAALASEGCSTRRQDLELRRHSVYLSTDRLRQQLLASARDLARGLGARSFVDLCSISRGRGFEDANKAAESLLAETADRYVRRLDAVSRAGLQKPAGALTPADIPRLESVYELRPGLGQKALAALWSWLGDIGLLPVTPATLLIDGRQRRDKIPRPFSIILRRGTVAVSIPPLEASQDLLALFHEIGHAIHFLTCNDDLPPEVLWIGDRAFDECYALLFESLLLEPGWLEDYLPEIGGADHPLLFETFSLLRARRSAGMFLYELRLFNEHLNEQAARLLYTRTLSNAFQFPASPECYLAYVEPFFRSADYVEARRLELSLRSRLRNLFGWEWYRNRRAAGFLRSIWRAGRVPIDWL